MVDLQDLILLRKERAMAWTNFLQESKKFCSYKDRNLIDKIKFWVRYPRAWLKFKKYEGKKK